jgi:hypothetical protein
MREGFERVRFLGVKFMPVVNATNAADNMP